MNIFVTDPCPRQCAKNLDDKRVVKMVRKTAQMLSTACREHGFVEGVYKSTHKNHPCNVWTRQTGMNYRWLLNHFIYLLEEYKLRFKRTHKCQSLEPMLCAGCMYLDTNKGALTPFANCAANKSLNLDFKSEQDVFKAYKMYLTERWNNDKRKPTWYGKEERPF